MCLELKREGLQRWRTSTVKSSGPSNQDEDECCGRPRRPSAEPQEFSMS